MIDTSVETLVDVGQTIALHFKTGLGYNNTRLEYITIDPAGEMISLRIWTSDDFQRDLPYTDCFHHPYTTIMGGNIIDLWAAVREHPNREVREITVVLKGTEGLRNSVDDIKSDLLRKELASAFTKLDIVKVKLLPAPSPIDVNPAEGEVTTKDEIPF